MIFRLVTYLCFLLCLNSVYSQEQNNASKDLLKQAQSLIASNDFEKAKLTLKLYQKYVEKDPQKWLDAQGRLIRCNIETNDFREAENLLKSARQLLPKVKKSKKEIQTKLNLYQAELYEIKNEFTEAEKIYRNILKNSVTAEIQIKLANNLIDRVLASYSSNTRDDYEELRALVSNYEKNNARNPLELIRIKQKVNSYQMINKETLENLEKLNTYWIRKDEFTLFRIYLNNVLRNYKQAYKIWTENKDLITLKTHPLSIPVLVNLSRHFLDKNLKNSIAINQALPVLIRDEKERALVSEITIEQLIHENKAPDALNHYQDFIKNYPQAHNKSSMILSLSEAFLKLSDFKTTRTMISSLPPDALNNLDKKSRKHYIDASLLQADGKDLDAAVLFLRVGQTAGNPQIALKSLFRAGTSFYDADQCNRSIIAFKMLLEKPRNTYTDEAMYYLARSHAQCKEYKQALAVIDQIVIIGKNPDLKKKALFEKGDYYRKAGDINKAIESYNDYTVVYTNDSRNAAIWMKIYKIHRSLKDLGNSEKILSKIISKAKQSSPDIYSKALHQKALIHQLKGQPRESINLWQKFLEFNQKNPTPLSEEVKLMLAASYQNSETFNLNASSSIYLDVLKNGKNKETKTIAAYNLLKLTESDTKVQSETIPLLLSVYDFNEEANDLLLESAIRTDKKLQPKIRSFINKIKNKDQQRYWSARFYFVESNYKTALKEIDKVNSPKYALKKSLLKKNLYLKMNKNDLALDECLEIIYSFSTKLAQKKYVDWQLVEEAALTAVSLLKESKKIKQIENIKKRIADSKIPNSSLIVSKIDKALKGK